MQAPSQGAAQAARQPVSPPENAQTRNSNAAAPRHIAITGDGFSGAAVTIQLPRKPPDNATGIDLRDPRAQIGAGVLYATHDYSYPLNAAAGQMSLDSAESARSQGIQAAEGDYLPRQVYGEYLRARDWEATAVPELREHAAALARRLAIVGVRGPGGVAA